MTGTETKAQLLGSYRRASGCVVDGLRDAKVNNPVFVLEGIDKAGDDAEDVVALLGVVDWSKRTAFKDAYLDVPLDLSGVLWIATATDAGAIPKSVRDCLYVIDLPAYTEEEKMAIAQEHLLARPFDDLLSMSAGILAIDPAASAASAGAASSSDWFGRARGRSDRGRRSGRLFRRGVEGVLDRLHGRGRRHG